MTENYSISRKQKLIHHPDCDQLSDLPLGIIHIILAFLPLRDAVRTCVLSKEWRYKWKTLLQLVFNDECLGEDYKSLHKCEDIIPWVLSLHEGPIHKFRMSCTGEFTNVDEWIRCLSKNGIQELVLDVDYDDSSWTEMRSSIYSCKKLTYLRLFRCDFAPPSWTFEGFLFLRCLSLSSVCLSPEDIDDLVYLCPVLESFELIHMVQREISIGAPNLKCLHLVGDYEFISIDAPLLTEISVEFYNYDFKAMDYELEISSCDYIDCFDCFTNLQKLSGSCWFITYLSFGIEFCPHSLAFPHLKVIDLDDVDFEDKKEIQVIARLVLGAPNLQDLKIRTQRACRNDELEFSFKDLGFVSNFKLEKLSYVSVYVNGRTLEVEFLKYLLESSPVLEKMNVELQDDTEEKQKDLMAKLEGCNWASSIVKLCNQTMTTSNRTPAAFLSSANW